MSKPTDRRGPLVMFHGSSLTGQKVLKDRLAGFADHDDRDGCPFPSLHASGGPVGM